MRSEHCLFSYSQQSFSTFIARREHWIMLLKYFVRAKNYVNIIIHNYHLYDSNRKHFTILKTTMAQFMTYKNA
jgi:hypothetical protein